MDFKEVMGVDVSKKTLDVYLHCQAKHAVYPNTPKGMLALERWLKQLQIERASLLTCLEHTGLYSLRLTQFLEGGKWPYVLESGLQIKRSMGIKRGKNDKVDAIQIARYAYLHRAELKLCGSSSPALSQLERLLSMRQRLVRQRSGFKVSLSEHLLVLDADDHALLLDVQRQMIHTLSKKISILDQRIQKVIRQDEQMKGLYELVTSVRGIGAVVGTHLLVITKGFRRFSNSRKFASYCGIAPFEHRSGTSLRGRTKVSPFANKNIKALLNMAALSAIQNDRELGKYYQQRVADGKNKMATLNIIRNKLVGRVFAVVKRGTPFVTVYSRVA